MTMPAIFSLWLLQLLASSAMLGLIWMIQIVHYPLFERVSRDHYVRYQEEHVRKITWVVLPLMATELVSAVAFCAFAHPLMVRHPAWLAALVLLAAIWLSTAFVQVPLHNRLASGFHGPTHQQLVKTNWIRTIAWTLRVGLVTYCGYHWFVTVKLLQT